MSSEDCNFTKMKKAFLLLFFIIATLSAFSQQMRQNIDPKVPFKDRLVFSGDIALQFGTFTFIGANPSLGYRWNDWLVTGLGAHYYFMSNGAGNDRLYGGQIFARAKIYEGALLMTEFQQTNTWGLKNYRSFKEPEFGYLWVPQWYIGAGYFQNIGNNVSVGGCILFDLIDDPNSPWQNPQIRGGLIIG